MCEQRRKLNHVTQVINSTENTIFILTMAGLMESPAVCRAATDMLDWETVVVGDVAWAAAIWAAVTWAEVTCMGCEVTCCTAACTGCMDAAWGWNIAGVFVCSWGWAEFRTVAAEWKIYLLTGSNRLNTFQLNDECSPTSWVVDRPTSWFWNSLNGFTLKASKGQLEEVSSRASCCEPRKRGDIGGGQGEDS